MMKKNILLLALSLLAVLTVQSCKKEIIEPERDQKLQLRFKNSSEERVKYFSFNGQYIGNIGPGKTTRYYSVDPFFMNDSNMPIVEAKARMDRYNVDYYSYGSEHTTYLSHGKHTMNVEEYMFCGVGLGLFLEE